MDYLYDLTLFIDDVNGETACMRHVKNGVGLNVHAFFRRIPVSNINIHDRAESAKFLHQLYREKVSTVTLTFRAGQLDSFSCELRTKYSTPSRRPATTTEASSPKWRPRRTTTTSSTQRGCACWCSFPAPTTFTVSSWAARCWSRSSSDSLWSQVRTRNAKTLPASLVSKFNSHFHF